MGTLLEGYNCLILDFDGTIANLQVDWKAMKNELTHTFGTDFTILDAGLMSLNNGELNKAFRIIKKHENAAEYTPNYALINYVKKHKKAYAIFSDNLSTTVKGILEKLGILDRFNIIVCKDDVTNFKPNPEGLWKILEALNIHDKSEAVFIGNSTKDELAAKATGIEFLNVESAVKIDDNKENMKSKLNNIAKIYDPSLPENDFDYWLLKYDFEVLKRFLIGDVVIELGSGRGNITKRLVKVAKNKLIVVEGSKKNLEVIEQELAEEQKVEFHHSLWQKFKYDEKVSDVVFFSGLEHLSEKDGKLVLEKIRSWMEDNSRLHLIVPNTCSLHRRIAWFAGVVEKLDEYSERDKMLGHKTFYTKQRLFDLLKDIGFETIHWEGILLKPFPNLTMLNLSLTEKEIEGLYQVGKELPDYCAHIYVCCIKKA